MGRVSKRFVFLLSLLFWVTPLVAQNVDEKGQCIPVNFDGIELNVFLFVDPNGGPNACSQGIAAGDLEITLDSNMRAHVSCWDNFSLSAFGSDTSVKGASARANVFRALTSDKSTYCARIGSLQSVYYDSAAPTPLTASDRLRIHGKIYTSSPQLELEFVRGRIKVRPRQACCTARQQCVGQITHGIQTCPKGSKPARKNSTCDICKDFSFESDSEEESQKSGCCVDGGCSADLPAQECSVMYGTSLPQGVLCSSSKNPCQDYTGACVISKENCREKLTESECMVASPVAQFLKGQACPKPEIPLGGCCDPMGMCRLAKQAECTPARGQFFPAGCPSTCPPQPGACKLACPNDLGVTCLRTTFQECMDSGGVGFNSADSCPTDPIKLMCDPPACYDCLDLALEDNYWPTLDGKLYLNEDCSNKFIDAGGLTHTGNWECTVKDNRRWIRIVWSNNKEITLWVHEDGKYIRLVPEEGQNRDTAKFPCRTSDLSKKSEGEMGTLVGKVKFVRSGNYLCATNKAYYAKEGGDHFAIFVYNPQRQAYEYSYRVNIEKSETARKGDRILSGTSEGGRIPTPWKFKFFNNR